jgi:sec-independent protein translocase protein TatC
MFESIKPHLVELRQRLGISVLSVFIGFIIAFTFHNAILGWITKPLNEALVQVGKIVESRNYDSWKISEEKNIGTKKETPKGPMLAMDISRNAQKMSQALHEAAELVESSAADKEQKALASLLSIAAKSALSIAENSRELKVLISDRLRRLDENATKILRESSFNGMITTHQVGGAFFVALKVSFFAGLLMAMPMILWQLWLFVAPGLYENEKKMVLPFVIGGSLMFMVGVLFAYYIVTPFGFQFLITFGSFLYTPLINIEDYVGFFTKIMFGFGLAFELPVFTYFLALLGLITDRSLISFFKYAIVIIFLVAALLTPPDVLTQLLMAAPLILLYGISILIVRAVNPEKEDEEDEKSSDRDRAEKDFGKLDDAK